MFPRWNVIKGEKVFNEEFTRNMKWCGKTEEQREKVIKALKHISDQGVSAKVGFKDLKTEYIPAYEREFEVVLPVVCALYYSLPLSTTFQVS